MYKTEFCRVEYLEDYDAVLCSWKAFCSGDDYCDPLRYGLKLLNEKKCRNWITDTTHGFENKEEDTVWLLNEFIPQTVQSSCENLFFIISRESPLHHEIAAQADALEEFFNVYLCEDFQTVTQRLAQGTDSLQEGI